MSRRTEVASIVLSLAVVAVVLLIVSAKTHSVVASREKWLPQSAGFGPFVILDLKLSGANKVEGIVSVLDDPAPPVVLGIEDGTLTDDGVLTFKTHDKTGDPVQSVWTGNRTSETLTLRREIETGLPAIQSFTLQVYREPAMSKVYRWTTGIMERGAALFR